MDPAPGARGPHAGAGACGKLIVRRSGRGPQPRVMDRTLPRGVTTKAYPPAIQWKVAEETTASTGAVRGSGSVRSAWTSSRRSRWPARLRRASPSIRADPSTATTRPPRRRARSWPVTLPLPQPASRAVSSPPSSRRSSTTVPPGVGQGDLVVGGGVPLPRAHERRAAATSPATRWGSSDTSVQVKRSGRQPRSTTWFWRCRSRPKARLLPWVAQPSSSTNTISSG